MKKAAAVAVLLIVAAVIAGAIGYRSACDPTLREAARQGDVSVWLRMEFHLTDSQYTAIEKLHCEYSGVCEGHCRAIRAALSERDALRRARPEDKGAVSAVDIRIRKLSTECESSLLRHLERVAGEMSAADGQRYLELMRPRVAAYGHAGAPELDLTAPHSGHAH
jgi:hypothetical protein